MARSKLKNKYIFYTQELSLKPDTAHEIHDVLCANAAANLGYFSVLTYLEKIKTPQNPLKWINPFQPQPPDAKFVEFFNPQEHLKVAPLPIAWPIDQIKSKFTNSSTIATKYYLPFHLLPHAKIIHTRDWNFVKAAIKNQIPVIYEKHYFQEQRFEPEIVNNPLFQIAITQSEPIRQSLIEHGMPPEKAVWLHNGFENAFLIRQPEAAQAWRQELLVDEHQHLVVYSGALYTFKGIDLLIEVAKDLPQIQFIITGGKESQVQAYQQIAREKNITNIKFLGWILPRERLISLLQAADILVHPHCAGKEADFTNPVKFFQYMAAGTPIVATKIPPLREFENSPLIACWCEPEHPQKFIQSLQYALEKYPRKKDGYVESINFSHQFSWENRAAKIISYVHKDYRPPMIA